MKINVITSSAAKFEQYFKLLGSKYEIVQNNLNVPEIQSTDQKEILSKKAQYAFDIVKAPIIIDETAIYFDKYNHFPGPFAKFVFQGLGVSGITKLIDEGEPGRIKTMVCYKDSDKEYVFDESTRGHFTKAVDMPFDKSFPYMSFFVPDGFRLPYTLLSERDRYELLPRTRAIKELETILYGLSN